MKGNKTKIASMILAASVALMASGCTVEFSGNNTKETKDNASKIETEAETEAKESSSETEDPNTDPTDEASETVSEPESTTASPETTDETQTAATEIPAPYVEVLDYLYDGIKSGSIKDDYENETVKYGLGMGIEEVVYTCDADTALKMIFYVLDDLDSNGTDELLIMYSLQNYDYDYEYIMDFYTLESGNLVHIDSGWARSAYYVQADKTLFYYGDGGYADNAWSYMYLSGSDLIVTDSYYSTNFIDGLERDEIYVFHVTGDGGHDEFIGYFDDDNIPGIGECYKYDNKTFLADYK